MKKYKQNVLKRLLNEHFWSDDGDFDDRHYTHIDKNAHPFVFFVNDGVLKIGCNGGNHRDIYAEKIYGFPYLDLPDNAKKIVDSSRYSCAMRNYEGRIWDLRNDAELR